MAILVGIVCVVLLYYVVAKMLEWQDSSNQIKSSIGCIFSTVLVAGVFIMCFLGACKSCTSDINNSSHDYDYYDAPRK